MKFELLLLALVVSCGTIKKEKETVVEPAPVCEPIIVEETKIVDGGIKEIVKVVEVEKPIMVPTDTPLFFTGQFCGRTVLEHDETFYVVHGQLMPIMKNQSVVTSGSCKIKFKDGVVREVKS